MKVVLISDDSKEAEALKRELTKANSAIHIDVASSIQEALPLFAGCDVIILDISVPPADATNLVSAIRKDKRPMGVIALMGSEDKDFPSDLHKSGVDHFAVKRPGYAASLAEMVQQVKNRYKPEASASPRRQVRLLYAGNFETAQRQLANVPQIKLEKSSITPDGSLQTESGPAQADALIVESSTAGANILKVIRDANQRMPDVPVILLCDPGEEETSVQAMRSGASDCITRSGNYFHRMLLVLQKEIARRELIRERSALRSREERLRHIVESMPAGVTVIAQDGSFMAINNTGLKLIGAVRLDQIVGKNISDMIPNQDRQPVLNFLSTVCGGTAASIRVNWKGPDGMAVDTEFRAVPMRRDAAGGTAALIVIDRAGADTQEKAAEETAGEFEAKLREFQEKHSQQAQKWEAVLKDSEAKRAAAEELQLQLRNAAEEAENRCKLMIEEHRVERENWEQARKGFQEQCAKIEEVAQSLKSAQASLLETHKAEQAQWENLRRGLEQKLRAAEENKATLESALKAAESSLSEQSQLRTSLAAEQNLAQSELDKKYRVAEEQRVSLAAALKDAESKIEQLNEKVRTESAQRDAAYRELAQKFEAAEKRGETGDAANRGLLQKFEALEKKAAEMESALRESESRISQMAEKHGAEIFQHDSTFRNLEQKYQAAEAQTIALQTALHDAQSSLFQVTETHNAEISRRDTDFGQIAEKLQTAEAQSAAYKSKIEEAEARIRQISEASSSNISQREIAFRELQQKCRTYETRTQELKAALEDAESRAAQLIETQKLEVSQRDLVAQELQQMCQGFEAQVLGLKASLEEAESKISRVTEAQNSEISQRDILVQELQKKCQTFEAQSLSLQKALQDAESKLAKLSEAQNSEISRRDLAIQELEQKCKALESQIVVLQSALHDAKSGLAQTIDMHSAELSRRDAAYQELEQKLQAAEEHLQAHRAAANEAKASLAQLTEVQRLEISKRESAYRELDEKLRAAENQIQMLQGDQSGLVQVLESHTAELAKRDRAQKELESKYQNAEKQRASLHSALQEAESSLAQINEKHGTELSQRDFAQKKAEQKYLTAEKQRIALEDALQDAQSTLAKTSEKYNTEHAQWDLARQEFEQKLQSAEKLQATAMQNAVRETESRLAWISEQNQAKAIQIEKLQQELEQLRQAHGQLTAAASDFHLRNQRLSQFTSAGVVLAAMDGRVLQCNDAAARIFGYASAEEALSQTGPDQFRIYAFEGVLANRLRQDRKLENVEWSSLGRDGRVVRVQENSALLEVPAGDTPVVERILTDISKMHNLSEEVRRARRMESTGDLAAATVKSLKDVCAALANSGELLLKSPADGAAVRQLAEALLADANRGVKHARQFLSVALKADRTSALLNLNDILVSNDALLHSLIGADIDLQTVLAPRLGLVSADHNEMVQLIGSLLASSREALPLGGTVTIETSNIEIDSLMAGFPAGLKPGIYVQIAFSADGCAVQPERRVGSNRTLIERMGGCLETINDPKLGNIHRVYIPRVETCAGKSVPLANTAEG